MRQLSGRTAVVTGAASGIGRELGRRFAVEGMRVVLADVDQELLADAATDIRGTSGVDVLVHRTDVTSMPSLTSLAAFARAAVGPVHVLCNNAGVLRPGRVWNESLDDARSVMDVNYWGVVHGIQAFVPAMLAHGEECHVVNTASAGGLVPLPGFPTYCASKFAVLALSEALLLDVQERGDVRLGVSVLCPGGVSSRIFASEAARRQEFGVRNDDPAIEQRFSQLADPDRGGKFAPEAVAGLVVDALRENRFYVLPLQAELQELVRGRLRRITEALDALPDFSFGALHSNGGGLSS
jgi:NAD(P)-dependent dehydrogenase (short-subunit alcohol dehydrogenase family)